MKALVTAASKNGATAEIAAALAANLRKRGIEADVLPPERVTDLAPYDAVVLGSAVYSGRWLPPARDLVARASEELRGRRVWLFSSGPVGDPSRRIVRMMGEDPSDLAAARESSGARGHRMFAGKIDRSALPRLQRLATRLFRLDGDFRDWEEIDAWAEEIAAGCA